MIANQYLDTNSQKAFVKNVRRCTEYYQKLLGAAVTEAFKKHKSISLCWLDIANAYGSVAHGLQGRRSHQNIGGANIIELGWGSEECCELNAFDTVISTHYCNSVCDELQRFKYENENQLKPSWTSEEWNGHGYSAKIMFWAHSWTAAEASVH